MITYDNKSWKINNKRIFILSAAIHYFRLPSHEWDEVLEKAKAGGCNTIETYIPWNFHEMEEGKWDFTGDKDLAHFFQLCADKDLYVIARPGPYICAEWDFGGLPWWLSAKKGIQYRSSDPSFLHYADKYFDQVIPIIDEFQFTKKGTIIMVQVENEFQAYGKPDQPYMEYLRDGMRKRGIEVPFVTCYGAVDGAVEFRNFWSHSRHAAGILDERFAGQPKGVMEFWIGWFEQWGGNKANQKTPEQLERECFRLLSNGFTAINYYMYFGGTNFDHWGGRTFGEQTFVTASYDYDGPLDEYLQPTEKYSVLSRFHSFVKWLEPVLTCSEQAPHQLTLPNDVTANRIVSPYGEIVFMENSRNERIQVSFTEERQRISYTIEPHACLPVIHNVNVEDRFTIQTMTAYTIGFGQTEAVIYHETGQRSSFIIKLDKETGIVCQLPNRYEYIGKGVYHFHLFHGSEPQAIQLAYEDGFTYSIKILDKKALTGDTPKLQKNPQAPSLKWETALENLDFLQGKVTAAEKPLDFSSFGQFSGYAGYESEFSSEETGVKSIVFPRVEDPAVVFANGKFIGRLTHLGADIIQIPVIKGRNKLTCLVQNMGRYNYTQALGEPKGISEAPAMNGMHVSLVDGWQVEGTGRRHHLTQIPKIEGRIAFLRRFHNQGFNRAILVGEGVSRVIVNGRPAKILLESSTGWSRSGAVYGMADISDCLTAGENVLDLDVEKISSIRRFDLYLFNDREQIFGWKTKAAAQLVEQKVWTEFKREDHQTVFPRWYRSRFLWTPADGTVVKLRLNHMSKGCFWVNGKCLGRYWNIGPQEDYKIPASILGEHNEIILFDEEGASPESVAIHTYTPIVNETAKQFSIIY